jgi:hypothetical protein
MDALDVENGQPQSCRMRTGEREFSSNRAPSLIGGGRSPMALIGIEISRRKLRSQRINDSWSHLIVLEAFSRAHGYGRIISYGADGQAGGEGVAGDIIILLTLIPATLFTMLLIVRLLLR